MTGLRIFLVAALMTGLTLFAVANNVFVPVDFGVQAFDVWLPLLVLAAFALGFLPVWLRLAADRMVLRRKVAKLEAALGVAESELERARIELLRPPATRPDAAPADAPLLDPRAEARPAPAVAERPQPEAIPRPAPPPAT